MNQQALSAFIWSVADLLRGDYKQSDYGKIILPFTVLRRLDCVTVERPLHDENGKIILGEKGKLKGKPQPDSSLRDTENAPLNDACIDPDKTKTGYEIPFNRHFYVFEPPRELAEIDADLKRCTDKILRMIADLSA